MPMQSNRIYSTIKFVCCSVSLCFIYLFDKFVPKAETLCDFVRIYTLNITYIYHFPSSQLFNNLVDDIFYWCGCCRGCCCFVFGLILSVYFGQIIIQNFITDKLYARWIRKRTNFFAHCVCYENQTVKLRQRRTERTIQSDAN